MTCTRKINLLCSAGLLKLSCFATPFRSGTSMLPSYKLMVLNSNTTASLKIFV